MIGTFVECRIEGKEIRDAIRLSREHVRANDTVWLMRDGALAADLPPAELMQSDRVRELFGFDAYAVTSGTHTWIVPAV